MFDFTKKGQTIKPEFVLHKMNYKDNYNRLNCLAQIA